MSTWQLQEAKARFGELSQTAQSEGPQILTRRGVRTFMDFTFDERERATELRHTSAPSQSQLAFMLRNGSPDLLEDTVVAATALAHELP